MFWLALGVALSVLFYFILIKPFKYWTNLGVPQYPALVVVRNTLLGFVAYRSFPEETKKVYDDFAGERYCGHYVGNFPTLTLRDPELIRQITVKDFDHFVNHFKLVPEEADPLWAKNLLSLEEEKWRPMRATLSPSFTSSKMKMMFGVIAECAKQFVGNFQDQGRETTTMEMKDAFTRFTNDVIASAAFGLNCDSMKDRDNQFYLMGKKITDITGFSMLWKPLAHLAVPKVAKLLDLRLFPKKASDFFRKIILDTLDSRRKTGFVRLDMIHLLLEAQKNPKQAKEDSEEPCAITDEDIIAQAIIFFLGGFETVSGLMCFMAHELAVNPDIQERLQREIEDVASECNGDVTYEALMKMKYMDMVISETARKWPGNVVTDRICTKPYTIEGEKPLHLNKGDSVWIHIYGLHHDPEYFPDPEKFDPERFSEENKGKIVPYTYLPFGAGPRSCIGNRFALMESKLLFFHLLKEFDIVVVDKTQIPLKFSKQPFKMGIQGGFWLGLKARTTNL